MDKEKAVKWLKLILKIGLSALAIYIFLRNIDTQELWKNIQRMRGFYFLFAILSFMLSKAIAAFRLSYFYQSQGLKLKHSLNLKLYWLGMYYNLFLPGGIGGDGYKVYFLKKHYKKDLKSLISASLLDRVSGLVAALALSCISFMFISFEWELKAYSFLLILPLYIGYWLGIKILFKSFLQVYTISSLLSLLVQALQVFAAYWVMKALWVEGNLANYIFVFLVSSIAYVIPLTIGGLGARELVFLFGAKQLNMDTDLSVAVGLVFYLVIVISSFSGVYFLLRPGELKEAKNNKAPEQYPEA